MISSFLNSINGRLFVIGSLVALVCWWLVVVIPAAILVIYLLIGSAIINQSDRSLLMHLCNKI